MDLETLCSRLDGYFGLKGRLVHKGKWSATYEFWNGEVAMFYVDVYRRISTGKWMIGGHGSLVNFNNLLDEVEA